MFLLWGLDQLRHPSRSTQSSLLLYDFAKSVAFQIMYFKKEATSALISKTFFGLIGAVRHLPFPAIPHYATNTDHISRIFFTFDENPN